MQSGHFSRRALYKLALAAAVPQSLARWAWANTVVHDYPFTLGIASGSPSADGMVLWTRLHHHSRAGITIPNTPLAVHWQIANDEHFRHIVQQGTVNALPELGHAVHIEVRGLTSNRWYFYRFMHGDFVSPTGRTRTMPAADAAVSQVRFAYASCQRWEHGFYAAYLHMQQESLDWVVFLGDYIYEYKSHSPNMARTLPSWVNATPETLTDYRARYAAYKSDIHLQAMHAHCPWIVTWDDHEVYNDYAATQGEDLASNFMERKAAAYQAFYEHMPLRASCLVAGLEAIQRNGEVRIYGNFQAGRLLRISVLDSRQYRDTQACPRLGRGGANTARLQDCPEILNPQRTLLGTQQESWLDSTLSQHNSQWNVIAQQTLFGLRNYSPSPVSERALLQTDHWDGYLPARQRLINSLQKHTVKNPVFIGGDIHQNWVGHVKADYFKPNSNTIATEFCGTSISSQSGSNDKLPQYLSNNPHYIFADAQHRGYGVVDLNTKRLQTHLRVLDDVTNPQSTIRTLASFEVQSG